MKVCKKYFFSRIKDKQVLFALNLSLKITRPTDNEKFLAPHPCRRDGKRNGIDIVVAVCRCVCHKGVRRRSRGCQGKAYPMRDAFLPFIFGSNHDGCRVVVVVLVVGVDCVGGRVHEHDIVFAYQAQQCTLNFHSRGIQRGRWSVLHQSIPEYQGGMMERCLGQMRGQHFENG